MRIYPSCILRVLRYNEFMRITHVFCLTRKASSIYNPRHQERVFITITVLSSFHKPVTVYINMETLRTVWPRQIETELTAVPKHSVIWNRDLCSLLAFFPKTSVPCIPPLNRTVLREASSRTVRSKGRDNSAEKEKTRGNL